MTANLPPRPRQPGAVASAAWLALAAALVDVEPACRTDPDRWFAVDPATVLAAAEACVACPAVNACRHYARAADERHGVWGALHRDPRRPLDLLAGVA